MSSTTDKPEVESKPFAFQPNDRVNLTRCAEAGRPDYTNMTVCSEPWKLGHGEEVVRCSRPSGKLDTFPTAKLVLLTRTPLSDELSSVLSEWRERLGEGVSNPADTHQHTLDIRAALEHIVKLENALAANTSSLMGPAYAKKVGVA